MKGTGLFFPFLLWYFQKFPRISYEESMLKYGSDKPDLRFDMKLYDVSDVVKDVDFKVFSSEDAYSFPMKKQSFGHQLKRRFTIRS